MKVDFLIKPINGKLVSPVKAVRLTWFQRLQRWLGF